MADNSTSFTNNSENTINQTNNNATENIIKTYRVIDRYDRCVLVLNKTINLVDCDSPYVKINNKDYVNSNVFAIHILSLFGIILIALIGLCFVSLCLCIYRRKTERLRLAEEEEYY